MPSTRLLSLSLLVLAASTLPASATILTLFPNVTDIEINRSTVDDGLGTLGFDGPAARVGSSGGGTEGATGRNYIMPFQLPALPLGETILTADLSVVIATLSGTPNFNCDLYGLPFGTSATPPASYFEGALDITDAVLIQNNLIPIGSGKDAIRSTQADGDLELAAYLQAQYDAGAVAGDFVYLRISPDVNFTNSAVLGYNVSAAGTAAAPVTTNRPTLTFETVPEPGSCAALLAGLGAMGLIRRRR